MISTNNTDLFDKLTNFRDEKFHRPKAQKSLQRLFYLIATYFAFNNIVYSLVYWLQENTPLLKHLTDAYHLDNKIHFPPDYLDQITHLEARVGLAQLDKYDEIIHRRQENAAFYDENLQGIPEFNLPPIVNGATYSHYVIRVPDRDHILKTVAKKGVQLGQLIEYSIPHMEAYTRYAEKNYPNSHLCSSHTINLPIFSGLSKDHLKQITVAVKHTREVSSAS